jgi:hypothetical protein
MPSILGFKIPKPVSFPKPNINLIKPSISNPLVKQKVENINKFSNALLYGRNDYQPKARQILQEYGRKKITAMEVRREPLPLALNVAMNIATLGEIAKNNPYDDLFHLSIVVKLDDGNYVLMEKNEVITLELNPLTRDKTESREVNLQGKHISLHDLLNNTQSRMGDSYFIYSARNNNCQDFIANVLVANGLDTPELIDFVKQDTIKVFGDMTRFRKFSNTLTDIAGRINVLREGYGENGIKAGGNISMHNSLSNFDIEEILSVVKNFHGVFSKDQLPKPIKNGWYIINLQNFAEGNGTHWTCFKYGKTIEYYDPFGFPPPIEVMRLAKGDIKWSPKQIQDEKSTACGYYCIARVLSKLPYQKFIDKFSNNNDINDMVLKEMLKKKVKLPEDLELE